MKYRFPFACVTLLALVACGEKNVDVTTDLVDASETISTAYHRPVYSPDGERMVFMKQSADTDGDWELFAMTADGKDVERLTYHAGWDGYATFSPDAEKIIFDRGVNEEKKQPVLMDLATGEETLIDVDTGWLSINGWLPNGMGVYGFWEINGQRDLYITDLTGSVIEQITNTPNISEHDAVMSADGNVLYFAVEHKEGLGSSLESINRTSGERLTLVSSSGRIYGTALSPDESILSYTDDTPGGDDSDAEIFFLTLQTGTVQQLTDNDAWDHQAVWRPGTDDVLFTSYRSGVEKMYRLDVSTGEATLFSPQ